jgi:hypothetical protein
MDESKLPKPYDGWRSSPVDRAEDAAYVFGCHFMEHCRAKALLEIQRKELPQEPEQLRECIEAAVDTALHNVVDLLEGFFDTRAGREHRVSYSLPVCVSDQAGNSVEQIQISPCLLDLPIGYWKWKDGEFR